MKFVSFIPLPRWERWNAPFDKPWERTWHLIFLWQFFSCRSLYKGCSTRWADYDKECRGLFIKYLIIKMIPFTVFIFVYLPELMFDLTVRLMMRCAQIFKANIRSVFVKVFYREERCLGMCEICQKRHNLIKISWLFGW